MGCTDALNLESSVHTSYVGGRMAILETFTTVGPMAVCYPRLNSTLPLADIEVKNPGTPVNSECLDLVNKVEVLGLDSIVRLLLTE